MSIEDIKHSFIVQAPAGSGKTSLLMARYLALLASVEQPEEIAAITFTKKAANEMRNRIFAALEYVAKNPDFHTKPKINDIEAHKLQIFCLAKKALDNATKRNWNLLLTPSRLKIQTIDSLCNTIANQMPMSSGLLTRPAIVSDVEAELIYREAVQEILQNFSPSFPQISFYTHALKLFLLHLDNNQSNIEDLLVGMLKHRDQWLQHIVIAKNLRRDNPTALRNLLEESLVHAVDESINKCKENFPQELLPELQDLLNFSNANLKGEAKTENSALFSQAIDFKQDFFSINSLTNWRVLADILLTKDNFWRVNVDKRIGFPPPSDVRDQSTKELYANMKERMQLVLKKLIEYENFRGALEDIRICPSTTYSDKQWEILESLLELLPVLVAELKLSFHVRGVADYIEIAMAAEQALGGIENPTDLALALDARIKHLLIDEFQDTSISQFRLIEKLIADWQNGDGRTLFLVGDPMQSIYRFRQAEVGLFLRAQNNGIGNIQLNKVFLDTNYRSEESVVAWVNDVFTRILPIKSDIIYGAVTYNKSIATKTNTNVSTAVKVELLLDADTEDEANHIHEIISHIITTHKNETIAILARTRSQLNEIISTLKRKRISYSAVELETLNECQVIQDLFALTRGLINFADRVAWLAILRAPWCGLDLHDLYTLASLNTPTIWESICSEAKPADLSEGAWHRLQSLKNVIAAKIASKNRQSLARWLEDTWLELSGPSILREPQDLEASKLYFSLLSEIEQSSDSVDISFLAEKITNLYAPQQNTTALIQVMTIHKAKGLEFDHVIIPGLGHTPRRDTNKLLLWLEKPSSARGSDLILAPLKAYGDADDPIYRYIRSAEDKKSYYEVGRLLYVAVTRAKKTAHLIGKVPSESVNSDSIIGVKSGSFLEQLIPCFSTTWLAHCENNKHLPIDASLDANLITRLTTDFFSSYLPNNDNNPTKSLLNKEIERWQDNSPAILGNIIHRCLQQLTEYLKDHRISDVLEYIKFQKKYWRKLLIQNGIQSDDLDKYLLIISNAISNTFSDERGKWLLYNKHSEAQSEYALSTVSDEEFINVIIDRTFLDDDVRWIVDYKTSIPRENLSMQDFLIEEKNKYVDQLEKYARALRNLETRPIRLGIYFPLCCGWCEWEFIVKN